MRKCQDSETQVLRPISNGTAWCGCCGQTVQIFLRPGDTNEIPFYVKHNA